jgi:hypothetical protein
MYGLSLAYLKREGATTILHTDSYGRELMGFLPYDEIHTTIDALPKWVDPKFFAAGKFIAQKAEPLGTIHIDGDVFLKRKALIEYLCCSDGKDFVVQHTEYGRNPIYKDTTDVLERFIVDPPYPYQYMTPVSCGVIGFFNQSLKDEYEQMYFDVLERVHKCDGCIEALRGVKNAIPDLIFEQQFLAELAEERGYSYKCALDTTVPHLQEKAIEVGFQHLITSDKWALLPYVKMYLRAVDPFLYSEIDKRYHNA